MDRGSLRWNIIKSYKVLSVIMGLWKLELDKVQLIRLKVPKMWFLRCVFTRIANVCVKHYRRQVLKILLTDTTVGEASKKIEWQVHSESYT